MNGIVIYKSRYGSTKQYAQWISEATGFIIMDHENVSKSDFETNDTFVICSYINEGQFSLRSMVINNWDILKNKNVYILSASAASPDNKKYAAIYLERSFQPDIREKIKYYPVQGKYIIEKLSSHDRSLLYKAQASIPDLARKELMFKENFEISKNNVAAIINDLKNL